MKMFRCRDTGMNCNAEITGADEPEVLQKAQEHARSVHNMALRSDENTMRKVRQAIKDI
jgi:predicted small metal-binding protein